MKGTSSKYNGKKKSYEINEGKFTTLCVYIYIYIKYIYIKIAWDGTLQPESIDCEMSSLKMRLVYVLKPLHNELLWLFDKLPPALRVW